METLEAKPWFAMPTETYADERKFYFEQLAKISNLREVELRVGLSNIFCVMMCRSNLRRV
jgi:hypothetical protein